MQHLLLIKDDQEQRLIALTAETSSIGRDASNSIVLHSQEVSRQHAILLRVTRPGEQTFLFRIIDGNLQGKPSTNGLYVNGRRCSSHDLRSGDTITFGAHVCARYYTVEDGADLDKLFSSSKEESDDLMETLIVPPAVTELELEKLHDAALVRLASFPELFSHPIIELSLSGELTYLNPAAVSQFPEIQQQKLQHPLLEGVIDIVKQEKKSYVQREVSVYNRIFEQSLNYIPQSDLIRSYLVEITERKQAEAALRENERRFRAIFNQTFQVSGLLNPQGYVLEMNQTALEFAGLQRADALGLQLWQTPAWQASAAAQAQLKDAIAAAAEGKFVRYETDVLDRDGQLTTLDFSLKPTLDEAEQVVLLLFEGRDISDYKRAEADLKALHDKLENQVKTRTIQFIEVTERLKQEENALLASYATNRALLNAIPDPMFRISQEGIFVNFKKPKQYSLPFDPEQCLHRHLADVLPQSAAAELQTCIDQALATGETQLLEFQLSVNQYEARVATSAEAEVMVIVRDITERKRSEAEIRRALERERELNEMKTRFVSMTSHEFRTPLTTILSSAELIEHYSGPEEKEKQLKYLRKIQTATQHMTELLNDVLLINQAEAGKTEFNPQSLELTQFCQEIVEELQVTTQMHDLQLRSQLPAQPLLCDRKLMRHILTNLLANAINYSPSGGDIQITLLQTADTIELKVQDSGIGIPPETQATLFDSFVRGSNVGTISGTGLGLAIVKKSVELHQGSISCDSTVGVGTTFTVRFPAQQMLAAQPSALPR
ncbi:MAG: PAS domain S-box protein [Leptolyngbya sp. SIO4C1]|nr:PAS domain S-box protein [Leptolyngbya sp. SIO4C1]